jgi:hypothetical protein
MPSACGSASCDANVSDNVLLLQFVPRNEQLRRDGAQDPRNQTRPDVREFHITPAGIVLDESRSGSTR